MKAPNSIFPDQPLKRYFYSNLPACVLVLVLSFAITTAVGVLWGLPYRLGHMLPVTLLLTALCLWYASREWRAFKDLTLNPRDVIYTKDNEPEKLALAIKLSYYSALVLVLGAVASIILYDTLTNPETFLPLCSVCLWAHICLILTLLHSRRHARKMRQAAAAAAPALPDEDEDEDEA